MAKKYAIEQISLSSAEIMKLAVGFIVFTIFPTRERVHAFKVKFWNPIVLGFAFRASGALHDMYHEYFSFLKKKKDLETEDVLVPKTESLGAITTDYKMFRILFYVVILTVVTTALMWFFISFVGALSTLVYGLFSSFNKVIATLPYVAFFGYFTLQYLKLAVSFYLETFLGITKIDTVELEEFVEKILEYSVVKYRSFDEEIAVEAYQATLDSVVVKADNEQ
ncbi:MAG: hypothetical protein OIF32_03625, partial [Campylobacterales bacterium]|nr:hypothetical protein [Campylobacterales bacterium]